MKRIIAFALIAFVFLSSTCKKAMQLPDPELKKLFGKWEWVSSTGGFAGKALTPSSEGYTARLEFKNNGVYRKYKNKTLTEWKNFSLSLETSIQNHQPAWVISLEGGGPKMAVSFSGNDTLMLNEQAHDGYGHMYVRIK